MANNVKVMDSIKDFLLKMKAMDADVPADLAEDALAMTEAVKDALCEDEEFIEKEETEVKDEEPITEEKIEAKVEDAMVRVMRKYGLIKDGCMEALDELENKLGTEDADEEDVTVDPEKINDSAKRKLLREIKPVIASVKDSSQRKAIADAFAKSLNMASGDSYGTILEATKKNAQDAMTQKMTTNDSDYDFGMEIAKKYNPHYMKEV